MIIKLREKKIYLHYLLALANNAKGYCVSLKIILENLGVFYFSPWTHCLGDTLYRQKNMSLYCSILFRTAIYRILLYCHLLYFTLLYCTVLYSTA
jgi:hypothetical protein